MVRLFIGVKLPREIQEKLASFQKKLVSIVTGSFVPLSNVHITLKFLGDVDKNQVDRIRTMCYSATTAYRFSCELKGVGVFPSLSYPRVIWGGVAAGSESLAGIWKALDEKLDQFGYKDDKEFHPHATLVRAKHVSNKDALRALIQNNTETKFGVFRVENICLMKSELSRTGATHFVVEEFSLK